MTHFCIFIVSLYTLCETNPVGETKRSQPTKHTTPTLQNEFMENFSDTQRKICFGIRHEEVTRIQDAGRTPVIDMDQRALPRFVNSQIQARYAMLPPHSAVPILHGHHLLSAEAMLLFTFDRYKRNGGVGQHGYPPGTAGHTKKVHCVS